MIKVKQNVSKSSTKKLGMGETFKYENEFYIKTSENTEVVLTGPYAGEVRDIDAIVDVVDLDCTEN